MTQMSMDNSPFTDIEINILKRYILDKCPEISKLASGQIDDLVKCIIDEIDDLYPNYTLIELYDILQSEISGFQNEVMEQIQLEDKFQRSCDLQEMQIIQYPPEIFHQYQNKTK